MAEDARQAVLLALEYLDGMRGIAVSPSSAHAQAVLGHLARQGFVVRRRDGEHFRLEEPAMARRRTSGAEIRDVRIALGLSIAQVAARAGVHEGGLARIERGRRSPQEKTLVSILDALASFRAEQAMIDRLR